MEASGIMNKSINKSKGRREREGKRLTDKKRGRVLFDKRKEEKEIQGKNDKM